MVKAVVDLLGYGGGEGGWARFLRFGRDRQNNTLTCLQNSRILFPRTSITKTFTGEDALGRAAGDRLRPSLSRTLSSKILYWPQ